VVLVCIAQALVQLGAFFWPDLLPRMIALWGLSYSEAGWITARGSTKFALSELHQRLRRL
jgi:hypothetical protein